MEKHTRGSDIQNRVPISKGHLNRWFIHDACRIVYQDVDFAKTALREIYRRDGGFLFAYVRHQCRHIFVIRKLRFDLRVDVFDHDACSLSDELLCNSQTDTASRPGHDRDLAREWKCRCTHLESS